MSDDAARTQPTEPQAVAQEPAGLRPWTPAAAMEPLPPLAPPPARPGAGRPVPVVQPVRSQPGRPLLAATLAVVLVAVAALLVALLLTGR